MDDRGIDRETTSGGVSLRIRPLQPGDAGHLVAIFDQMSEDSRYLRFMQPVGEVSEARKWAEAERIAHAVVDRSGGLIAFADLPQRPNAAVAAARYICTDAGTAEAAISVIDAVQRRGVGALLMRRLVEMARQDGVRRLQATIRAENLAIWKILQRLGRPLERRVAGGAVEVTVMLGPSSEGERGPT